MRRRGEERREKRRAIENAPWVRWMGTGERERRKGCGEKDVELRFLESACFAGYESREAKKSRREYNGIGRRDERIEVGEELCERDRGI